jgi:hypothetical protein
MKSAEWLWQVKTGRRSAEIFVSPAMRRGIENEKPAREKYEQLTGVLVSPAFGEMDDFPFVRSSFDGVDLDQVLTVEIKCPNDEVHAMAKDRRIVEYYQPQLAHQGLTLWGHPDNWDGKFQHFVSYHPETGDIAIVEKVRTGDGFDMPVAAFMRPLALKLLEEEISFWKSVREQELPCGDDWRQAASLYLMLDAKVQEATAERDEARAALIELLGKKDKMSGAGVSVTRSSKRGSVDYAGLIKELNIAPEVVEKHRKAGTSTTITIRTLTGAEKDTSAEQKGLS